MTAKTRSTLHRLDQIGRSDVALPLSRTLFSDEVLTSAAGGFPKTVRFADRHLVLTAAPNAHAQLRDMLRHLYVAQP